MATYDEAVCLDCNCTFTSERQLGGICDNCLGEPMSQPIYYSVVILTESNGLISRTVGTVLSEAIARADQRREDFPTAKEINVVSFEGGVHYTC
jgi:hypothetical protein